MENAGWDGTWSGLMDDLNFDEIDWQRELTRIGSMAGIGVASFISSRIAAGLALRVLYTVGGSYGGGALGILAFHLVSELRGQTTKSTPADTKNTRQD